MSNCQACGTAMLPLFTGEFCPNDCDRKTLKTWTWLGVTHDPIEQIAARIHPELRSAFREGAEGCECPWYVRSFQGVVQVHATKFGTQAISSDQMHRADVVFKVNPYGIEVLKNRYGGCKLEDVPLDGRA